MTKLDDKELKEVSGGKTAPANTICLIANDAYFDGKFIYLVTETLTNVLYTTRVCVKKYEKTQDSYKYLYDVAVNAKTLIGYEKIQFNILQ